jgi:hypothetical protein
MLCKKSSPLPCEVEALVLRLALSFISQLMMMLAITLLATLLLMSTANAATITITHAVPRAEPTEPGLIGYTYVSGDYC